MELQYHPSYGYATKSHINQLKKLGVCAERDQILKDIATQTKAHTKKPSNRK